MRNKGIFKDNKTNAHYDLVNSDESIQYLLRK